jgi:hypothetical protein
LFDLTLHIFGDNCVLSASLERSLNTVSHPISEYRSKISLDVVNDILFLCSVTVRLGWGGLRKLQLCHILINENLSGVNGTIALFQWYSYDLVEWVLNHWLCAWMRSIIELKKYFLFIYCLNKSLQNARIVDFLDPYQLQYVLSPL